MSPPANSRHPQTSSIKRRAGTPVATRDLSPSFDQRLCFPWPREVGLGQARPSANAGVRGWKDLGSLSGRTKPFVRRGAVRTPTLSPFAGVSLHVEAVCGTGIRFPVPQ
jgi:hypothetical protein